MLCVPPALCLALEPLDASIRASPGIVWFKSGQRTDVSLYAVDTVVSGDAQGLLQAVMALINHF